MKPRLSALIAFTAIAYAMSSPAFVFAAPGGYQTCPPSAPCDIGEFLYDDEYAPIATATCTLTSRNPDGTVFLTAAPMTANADGWYKHTVSAPATIGIYRSQVCCTAGADYLCLDKTFEVAATASALTAAGVWGYSGRTLTGFGSLVADVWAYSSRSLSSFGTLVADVWSNTTRTITGGGDTVSNTYNTTNNNTGAVSQTNTGAVANNYTYTSTITAQQISDLMTMTAENRRLLERIVNKPVVKTTIDEGDLQSKLEKTRNLAGRLYSSTQELKSRAELLDLKWDSLTPVEIATELEAINTLLKADTFKENSSIIASTDWLKSAWNSTITLNLSDQVSAAQSKIQNLISDFSLFGKPKTPISFKSALTHLVNLDTLVGTSLNTEGDTTLYGYLKGIERLVSIYEAEAKAAHEALAKLETTDKTEIEKTITELTAAILASNQVPQAEAILSPAVKKDQATPKNKILNLIALINTNLSLLASSTGKVINNIWLEEGSIIFRAVATNPSKSVTQKVPIEIYLPEELKQEQVIQASPGLTIEFNQQDNRLWAVGEVELSPQETATFFVEVEDIWKYAPEEVDSLKKQVDDLAGTLKNTSFFAQGTSLKSDIDVALDKILLRQKQAVTPESRIKTYRESRLEMVGISQKIDALKLLTAQASATGSIFGFVGGVQAVAVWGLIIILIAGFVFLTLYMRTLRLEHLALHSDKLASANSPISIKYIPPHPPLVPHRHLTRPHRTLHHLTVFFAVTLLAGGFSSYAGSIIIKRARQPQVLLSPLSTNINFQILGVTTEDPTASASAHLGANPAAAELNQ